MQGTKQEYHFRYFTANATDALSICISLVYIHNLRLILGVGIGITGVNLLLVSSTLLVF